MIGARLGKWLVIKELGRGGMGRVYLAKEESSQRQVAVKVLSAELAQEEGFRARFEREIDALSRLDHPGIVRFFEAGLEHGTYYYAMEYVEGRSLDEILLAEGRFSWQDVLQITIEICPALRHVHDHGIIHRDLKPPNIMRAAGGAIKLTDFGIAKVFAGQHLTATGGVIGTAEFISPEQAAGKPVGKRSDLYCLGVVLYTLLTGRTPFEGTSYLDLLHKHRYAQFDPARRIVPEIPYEIDELVCQLLEKSPEKRPADCYVLGRQLDTIRRKLERKGQPTEPGGPLDPTVAENRAELKVAEGPGAATLMSQMVRAELDRQYAAGPLARFFNRAGVLVGLLAVCVGMIVWAFWPPGMETLYSRGAQLMVTGRLSDMREAWREYLGPLNTRFPDHPYQEEVENFRQRLKAAEADTPSEAQRFYQQGERLSQQGDLSGARRVWQNTVAVFADVPSERDWVRRAERALVEMDKSAARDPWPALKTALDRAAVLRDHGQRDEAEKIWTGIEELYRGDPAGTEVLRKLAVERKK